MAEKKVQFHWAYLFATVFGDVKCYGSGSADPYLCLMDPDPAIFVSDLQDAN